MLKGAPAFSGFSVDDLQKARAFYEDALGLEVTEGEMGALNLHIANGVTIFVYPKPNHVPATFTILNFVVPNIEKTVDELSARGAQFQQYDMPELKTDAKGIAHGSPGPNIAWFTDPAGNVMSVIEEG
jgi:catechol 2,3-dioxygenase-like lactoylglutathione lyase family enzyme